MIKPVNYEVKISLLGDFSTKTESSLILEDNTNLQYGKVVAVPSKVRYVEVDWLVVFSKYSGVVISDESGEYLLVNEQDLLCRLEEVQK